MRLIFMGTSAFGVPALQALQESKHDVVAVYSQPPRPAGRGHRLTQTGIHNAADALSLPVFTPESLKSVDVQEEFHAKNADLAVVASYGLLLPEAILNACRLGAINLHSSLLPRWRGAAPIHRALLAGDNETGVCIFQMEKGLDTGPVFARDVIEISDDMTADQLHDALASMAAPLLLQTLDALEDGSARSHAQPAQGVTYAHKITKAEGRLNFDEPAVMIERRLRTLNPRPGCHCFFGDQRLMLLSGDVVEGRGRPGEVIDLPLTIACGDAAIRVRMVKKAGKNAMTPDALQRGLSIPLGTLLD